MKIDPQTKQPYGQENINDIKKAISAYGKLQIHEDLEEGPFQHLARKIIYLKGDKEKEIEEYLQKVKNQLIASCAKVSGSSDISMKSATHSTYEGESQEEEEAMDTQAHEAVLQNAEQFLQREDEINKGESDEERNSDAEFVAVMQGKKPHRKKKSK